MAADLDLCYLPATDIINLFTKKKLSPVEYMATMIARAEETNPKINAFSFTFYDEALKLAKKAEARYARGARTGALEGLAIGIKDENYLKGKPTSYGLIDKDIIADKNSPNNERILAAAGLPIARTCVPELSITPYTSSTRFGVTRNPWNTDMTPGGSTGGGAASLAAGSTSLAMGSDIGGSIRIPASCCGLVGYKPPHGRNPDDTPFNIDPYCHTGPIARNVKDVILLQNVISGVHPLDMTSLREKIIIDFKKKSIKGWRIAYSIDLGHYEVDHEVRKNTMAAIKVFKDLGCVVEEVDLGWTKKSYEGTARHLEMIFGVQVDMYLKESRRKVSPYTKDFGRRGAQVKLHDFIRAMDEEGRMYETFSTMMEQGKYDLFICPTTALPAVPADHDHSVTPIKINGKDPELDPPMLNWVMTSPFNTLNRCPILAVPSGRAANQVPTGIQIIGKTYCDQDVFTAGLAYENAVGQWFADKKRRPDIGL